MQLLSTSFLIIALAIVVNHGVTAQVGENYDRQHDQVAQEAKNRAVTIIDGPKLVTPQAPALNATHKPEQRPSSKPPITAPEKHAKPKYVELPRLYYGQIQSLPPLRQHYNKPLKIQQPNTVYKYHKVIPLQPLRYSQKPLAFAASTNKPSISKSPKFSLPVETVNGIRSDFVRPPHFNTTSTSTTTAASTTRMLRTKRIWPKHILDKMNTNSTSPASNSSSEDLHTSASVRRYVVYVNKTSTTTLQPSTSRGSYRPVTRIPKKKATTAAPENYTHFEVNDWVPIVPAHFPINKVRKFKQKLMNRRSDMFFYEPEESPTPNFFKSMQQTPMNRRSDIFFYEPEESQTPNPRYNKRMVYLQSYGLVPMANSQSPSVIARKNIIVVGKKKPLNSHVSGYRKKPVHTSHVIREYDLNDPKIMTKIKHHHHHHHHRYVKTVEKPIRVEVPKPVPVPVPMPVPVKVEHRVPYPVPVKIPHPVPVKVIEKEYVPKPYPVFQQVEVKVPYPVEKRVPYPVEVKVNVPYPVEKKVPYPVPVRVLVPQPYPVETKVPYAVKEPFEVIKHVKVPYPQPYPVKVPVKVEVAVEKRIPYPVEVEKKVAVPVPYRVNVPEKVEVEKRVPVYVPRPYPVEKRVPVPVKVPYPVRVPIRVPFGIPILVHPSSQNEEDHTFSGTLLMDDNSHHSHYAYAVHGNSATNSPDTVTELPQHTVTVHGNGGTSTPHHTVTVHGKPGFTGFQSRSDIVDETTTDSVTTHDTVTNDPASTTIGSSGSELKSLSADITTPTLDPR